MSPTASVGRSRADQAAPTVNNTFALSAMALAGRAALLPAARQRLQLPAARHPLLARALGVPARQAMLRQRCDASARQVETLLHPAPASAPAPAQAQAHGESGNGPARLHAVPRSL